MNLEAVYPNENDSNEEISIEELRAKSRGWLTRNWAAEIKQRLMEASPVALFDETKPALVVRREADDDSVQDVRTHLGSQDSTTTLLDTTIAVDLGQGGKGPRPKKMKIKEIRGETQTSTNISPYPHLCGFH